jgi:hypothetical protein
MNPPTTRDDFFAFTGLFLHRRISRTRLACRAHQDRARAGFVIFSGARARILDPHRSSPAKGHCTGYAANRISWTWPFRRWITGDPSSWRAEGGAPTHALGALAPCLVWRPCSTSASRQGRNGFVE